MSEKDINPEVPKRLDQLEKEVIRHDGEIKILDNRVTNLENVSLRLENTLLREGQETRKVLEQVIQHTQNMEKIRFSLIVKIFSAGGLVYIIVQTLLTR